MMKPAFVLLALAGLAIPGFGDTIELITPSISINGKVSFEPDQDGGRFRIDIGDGKTGTIGASNVKRIELNAEAPSKKIPTYKAPPIKRGLLRWTILLRNGESLTGELGSIDGGIVQLNGKPLKRSDVAAITPAIK